MKDLEKRMKENYENREKHYLPRRTNTIIRVDGKNFSKYTKNFEKPYDPKLSYSMELAMVYTADAIQGLEFAYTQSDEISFYLRDDYMEGTQAYFDGNVQKIASVTASMVTAYFNRFINRTSMKEESLAMFDARVFTIPDDVEVENYFIWRNMDAMRNAITTIGRYQFGHKEIYGKSTNDIIQMLEDVDYDVYNGDESFLGFRYGKMLYKAYDNENERYRLQRCNAFDFAKNREEFVDHLKGNKQFAN